MAATSFGAFCWGHHAGIEVEYTLQTLGAAAVMLAVQNEEREAERVNGQKSDSWLSLTLGRHRGIVCQASLHDRRCFSVQESARCDHLRPRSELRSSMP